MKVVQVQKLGGARRAALLFLFSLMAFALLVITHSGRAQSQDGRARRTTTSSQQQTKPAATAQKTPSPKSSPTPKPGLVRPGQVVLDEAPPPEIANPAGAEIGENETIKINTELVNLNVRVIDRNNRPIGDISQNEIHVFENGVPQPIFYFSKEEVPISYGLAIDTSGSMRSQLSQV
nr:hypothetical protein [Acidobacteriota bacterium]